MHTPNLGVQTFWVDFIWWWGQQHDIQIVFFSNQKHVNFADFWSAIVECWPMITVSGPWLFGLQTLCLGLEVQGDLQPPGNNDLLLVMLLLLLILLLCLLFQLLLDPLLTSQTPSLCPWYLFTGFAVKAGPAWKGYLCSCFYSCFFTASYSFYPAFPEQ